jgi:hypothetical protein
VGFFSDLLLTATLTRTIWELAAGQVLPAGFATFVTVAFPFLVGAGSRQGSARTLVVLPSIGRLAREGLALVTLVLFLGALHGGVEPLYWATFVVGFLAYLGGRLAGATWRLVLAAGAIAAGAYLVRAIG